MTSLRGGAAASTPDEVQVNTTDKLVYMANQIASNFARLDEPEAAHAIADHIARFWDPGMRRKIFNRLDEPGHGLSVAAADAVRSLRKAAKGLEK
jgi:formate dehydrogenase subunit delta